MKMSLNERGKDGLEFMCREEGKVRREEGIRRREGVTSTLSVSDMLNLRHTTES